MEPINCTYFILTVFSEISWVKMLLFGVFLKIYIVTIMANLLLIILRLTDPQLHTPMYFFLSHLSSMEIIFTSSIVPKLLWSLLSLDAFISFQGCMTQMFTYLAMGTSECFLLTIMAYDRHMAICQPLRYHVLMNQRICVLVAAICWIVGCVNSFLHTVFTFLTPCFKSIELRHFFCEIQPLLRLSCADTHIHELALFSTSVTASLCTCLLILCSYIHIISTILKIQSSKGKSKAFSTCSSHILVVIIFFVTIMSIYMKPISSYTPERDRVVAVVYTMGIPMFNPLIYSMRNKEIKAAVKKALGKMYHFLEM